MQPKVHHAVRYALLLVLVIGLCMFNAYTIVASDDVTTSEDTSKYSYDISYAKSEQSMVADFAQMYDAIVHDYTIDWEMTRLNDTETLLYQLDPESYAIKLPENRIALRYDENLSSVLPPTCKIVTHDDDFVITFPGDATALKVTTVVDFPVMNLTKNVIISQSINELDAYQVNLVFIGFYNPIVQNNTINYTVDWGDGTTTTYDPSTFTAHHMYAKSALYSLSVSISDAFGFSYSSQRQLDVEYEGDLAHSYLWAKKNKEPLAVTSSASIGLFALSLVILTETGKYKFLALLPLLIPLYTRIQKEDVLDQFVRGQIYGYIKTHPGVHYNKIRRDIDVKNGTLSYHLSVLEKTELIKSRREGMRYRAFYPTGMKFPKKERFRLTELQIQILDVLEKHKYLHQKQIAKYLQKKPQTINYNVKVLAEAGLIEIKRKGRKSVCYPVDNATETENIAQ